MPRTTQPTPELADWLDRQDRLVTVDQLVACGYSRQTVHRRVREGRWQRPLPGVIATTTGDLTRRQRIVVAWLWAGPESAVDAEEACVWHGVRPPHLNEALVHVAVPAATGLRSRDFVVVRRTLAEIRVAGAGVVPYVDRGTAIVVAARNAKSKPAAIALLSRALQLGVVTTTELWQAREGLGDKYCRPVDDALIAVGVGLRSPGEADAYALFNSLRGLPEPLWNQWIDLGDGGPPLCLDAIWPDARLVHEVNGKRWHAWDATFEDMQRRHDRLVAAGLIALHNSPSRLRTQSRDVCAEVMRTYLRYAGSGLPTGVRLIKPPAWSRASA